jgi:hypothetical protein
MPSPNLDCFIDPESLMLQAGDDAERQRLEGDGWVNWSGLATLLDELARTVAAVLGRLQTSPTPPEG